MRVWVSRAEPEARRTAERLVAAGHRPFVWPLLTVQPLDAGDALAQALEDAGALAFTSANGVRAFAALRPVSDRELPVFTVGQATARAALAAGFLKTTSAEGDVKALAKLIAQNKAHLGGAVLHPAALEPAGDLMGDLERRGVAARAVAVYDTRPAPPPAEALAALDAGPPGVDAVLIHSAKAAGVLAAILDEHPARTLTCVCISRAAAQPLTGASVRRVVAKTADEAAMIERLAL